MNRYFIIILPFDKMSEIYDIIVETPETLRNNDTNSKVVVKLPKGDTTKYAVLNSFKEYTHEQILIELQNPEWANPLPIIKD